MSTSPLVSANIIWDNANYGFYVNGSSMIDVEYNDIGTVSGSLGENVNNVSTDPHFVDGPNRNLRLSGTSPLLGFLIESEFPSGGFDVAGASRPSDGFYDPGAYEETIFTDHGFEGN